MINLSFRADKHILQRLDQENVTTNSKQIHKCAFQFSEEWADMEKTAIFKRHSTEYNVLLDNEDCCLIPSEALLDGNCQNLFVGVFGNGPDGEVITSTLVQIDLLRGASTQGVNSVLNMGIFEQIIKKIDEVKKGEIEPSLILEAATEYFNEHPIDDIVVDEVVSYVTEHAAVLKGEKGDKGDRGERGLQGIQGEKGEDGKLKYVHFEIDENGHLIERGGSSDDITFELQNGRMEVIFNE